ncbi:Caspase domain protein [uncultured archaeon]|nr:Caspase domain protein [uncultured archaeon]
MKSKTIGILVCGLLIATCILPVCGVESVDNKINDSSLTLKQIHKDTISTDGTEYWALLVAVGVYLNHPEMDRPSMLVEVEDLYNSLLSSENWESSHIQKITGENANNANIISGLRWLAKMDDGDDIALVYITTHGGFLPIDIPPRDEADGKDELLVPYEGFDDSTKDIWDDELIFLLNLLESKGVCVIIDSCYSGGFNDRSFIKGIDKPIGRVVTKVKHLVDRYYYALWMEDFSKDVSGNSRVVLMSCGEEELSYGSYFSGYIADGLRGNADSNKDKVCSAEEVFNYARPRVEQLGMQHPTILDLYAGDLPLTGEIT